MRHLRILAALGIFGALLGGCTRDEHDDDGGNLMIREEERVKVWLGDLARVTEDITGSAQAFLMNTVDPDETLELMRNVRRTRPPLVQDNTVNRQLREFHAALTEVIDQITDLAEEAQRLASSRHGGGLLGGPVMSLMSRLEDLTTAMTRTGNLARSLIQTLAVDFQDDPAFRSELPRLITSIADSFSGGGTGMGGFQPSHRTLPSQSGRTLPSQATGP
ncbi:hypothetical protein JXA47_07735 [Candidatus Sumerlaeota bacterium]|nr:hypothetical protein [Candidatus Sumerlaeota bacterium]